MNTSLALLAVVFFSLLIASNGTKYHQLVQEKAETNSHDTIKRTVFEKYGERSRRQSPPTGTPTNVTVNEDHHTYYTSRFIPPGAEADSLWFELSDLVGSGGSFNNVTEARIQDYYRFYQLWRVKFNFSFYGHILNTVAVTTGGFLYTGTFLHDQIHLTQFIAPLQADFNPSLNETAKIYVYNTEKRFTVQWDEVHNHNHVDDGPFSFQVSIFPNGTIYFVYKEIPLSINRIDNDNHPVLVGLADSFYVDTVEGFFLVRHIYEYSRILLNATQNLANSAYIITPIKNCVVATSCGECTAITGEGNFDCKWCPSLNHCSDGVDRHRQRWIVSGCHNNAITCPSLSTTSTTVSPTISPTAIPNTGLPVGASVGISVLVIMMILILVIGVFIVIFLVYIYKRPGSRFGRIIKDSRHTKAGSQEARVVYETDGVHIMDDTDDVEETEDVKPNGTDL